MKPINNNGAEHRTARGRADNIQRLTLQLFLFQQRQLPVSVQRRAILTGASGFLQPVQENFTVRPWSPFLFLHSDRVSGCHVICTVEIKFPKHQLFSTGNVLSKLFISLFVKHRSCSFTNIVFFWNVTDRILASYVELWITGSLDRSQENQNLTKT
jgi:hypothetical protein